MVSFRFHLISLIAVFLALGLGIAVGASVVQQATVDTISKQLHRVEDDRKETDKANDALVADAKHWKTFADQATYPLIAGRLTSVPVLVIAVRGTDGDVISALRDKLVISGAKVEGTVWFTAKMALDPKKPDDASALADALELSVTAPDALRQAAIAKVAAAWGTGGTDNPITALRQAGFLDYDAPSGGGTTPALASIPFPQTRFVIASQATAEVPNEVLAGPFAAALAKAAAGRVVAVEPGSDTVGTKKGERAVFVGPLRSDSQVAPLLSTVDNLEDIRGQVATIYALSDLAAGRLGHYGVGTRATKLLPDESPPP